MSTPTRWAVGVLAIRTGRSQHTVCVVDAVSQAEAEGLGMRIARKLYPTDDGWYTHHAVACPIDDVVTEKTAYAIVSARK